MTHLLLRSMHDNVFSITVSAWQAPFKGLSTAPAKQAGVTAAAACNLVVPEPHPQHPDVVLVVVGCNAKLTCQCLPLQNLT